MFIVTHISINNVDQCIDMGVFPVNIGYSYSYVAILCKQKPIAKIKLK